MNYIKIQNSRTDRCRKKEQKVLRREFVDSFKRNLRGQLDNISIQELDGSITNLGEKYGNKRDIRARILEKRTHMTQEEWEFKSDLIVKRLMEHPFFVEAREIYCYMDYRREVGTRRIIEKHGN